MLLSLKDIIVLAVHFGFSLSTTSVMYEYDPTLMTCFVILENQDRSNVIFMEIGTYNIVRVKRIFDKDGLFLDDHYHSFYEVKTHHVYDKAHYKVVDLDE